MSNGRLRRVFLPPAQQEALTAERVAGLATMRQVWVALAIGLDLSLYLLLRRAPGLRPEVMRIFAFVNIGLMVIDLGVTRFALRRPWRGYRAALIACVLCEALAAMVWIQMTGSVSSYFLLTGFLLILIYRLLFDYATGLACALAFAGFHTAAFLLESQGILRPASLFASASLGGYEVPLFRLSAMLSLDVGYTLAFLAGNFFVGTLRDREAALKTAQRDLARAVDETRYQGRLCGQLLAERYELHELIGRGGMGEVYMGRRVDDGRAVAIKVLHGHLVDRAGMRERFHREASLVSRLPLRHVAEMLECGATKDGTEYIVMEYLQGEDLARVLQRCGRLPLEKVTVLIEKIAAALEAAHAAGVVHRDLKPENVFLLEGTDCVRLLDFGIARLQEGDGLTLASELLGTPGYMAPEQARGDTTHIGPHTDVFALGAIAYRALTGKSPFPSRAAAAAVYESLHLIPPPPSTFSSDLPVDVDCVLALALAKEHDKRYARPTQLAEGLRLAARGVLDDASRASAERLNASHGADTRFGAPTLH
jgi:serine/threonine-protein kinase